MLALPRSRGSPVAEVISARAALAPLARLALDSQGGAKRESAVASEADLPRERLSRLGPDALSDAELVALLLRTGGRGSDSLAVAQGMLRRCGGLRSAGCAPTLELLAAPGIGPAKLASLQAAFEIGRRIAAQRLSIGDPIRTPDDVYRHFYQRLRSAERECFLILLLDGRQRILREELVSQGTLTASLVHPREVFRAAVRDAAAAVILVHNHPSGDPTPSREDHEVTRRLARAGEIMGIRVLDHVVVAEHGYHSFEEAGDLTTPEPAG
jgi:DNA repair protein RadC